MCFSADIGIVEEIIKVFVQLSCCLYAIWVELRLFSIATLHAGCGTHLFRVYKTLSSFIISLHPRNLIKLLGRFK